MTRADSQTDKMQRLLWSGHMKGAAKYFHNFYIV